MVRSLVVARPRTVALAVAAVLLALVAWQLNMVREGAPTAHAALGVTINMKVTGQVQGAFKGDDNSTSKTIGLINVSGYQFDVVSPRDATSGQATGRHSYKPIVVTHVVGGSTPQFLTALVRNENLKTVVINFFRSDRRGLQVNFLRVTLTNANLSEVHDYTGSSELLEDDSFVFQKIQVDELVAHTTFSDNITEAA